MVFFFLSHNFKGKKGDLPLILPFPFPSRTIWSKSHNMCSSKVGVHMGKGRDRPSILWKMPELDLGKEGVHIQETVGIVSVLSSGSYANLGVGERQSGVETIQCGMLELEEMQ